MCLLVYPSPNDYKLLTSTVRDNVLSTMSRVCLEVRYLHSGNGLVSSSLNFVMSELSIILVELSATSSNPILQIIQLIQISLDSFSRILSFQVTGST